MLVQKDFADSAGTETARPFSKDLNIVNYGGCQNVRIASDNLGGLLLSCIEADFAIEVNIQYSFCRMILDLQDLRTVANWIPTVALLQTLSFVKLTI